MKHNDVYQLCVLSLISLSVLGNNLTDRLKGISLNHEDNPRFIKQIVVSDPELLTISHSQLNGNLMAKSSEASKSLYSTNIISDNQSESDLQRTDNGDDEVNTESKNSKVSAPGIWESPSRTSLMRLHEFLLMEQLMQD